MSQWSENESSPTILMPCLASAADEHHALGFHRQYAGEGTTLLLVAGLGCLDMREADDILISKGSLCVDSRDTTLHHIGELMTPLPRVSWMKRMSKGRFTI